MRLSKNSTLEYDCRIDFLQGRIYNINIGGCHMQFAASMLPFTATTAGKWYKLINEGSSENERRAMFSQLSEMKMLLEKVEAVNEREREQNKKFMKRVENNLRLLNA